MQGTIESIHDILVKGRINDAYALLRKYYDATIINIYTTIYLQEHFDYENYIVKRIDDWRHGKESIPEYQIMSSYIRNSPLVTEITAQFYQDKTYKEIRNRCNDHTHYNFYRHLLINDNEIFLENERVHTLGSIAKDVKDLVVQHLSYLFFLNGHYMISSDYLDSLEMGVTPEPGSEKWVAPFIQEIFNDVISKRRAEVIEVIKRKTGMELG